jgi:hypothetical protein
MPVIARGRASAITPDTPAVPEQVAVPEANVPLWGAPASEFVRMIPGELTVIDPTFAIVKGFATTAEASVIVTVALYPDWKDPEFQADIVQVCPVVPVTTPPVA